MSIAAALLAAQLVLPSGAGVDADRRIGLLAGQSGASGGLYRSALLDRRPVLSAFRRVGLRQGCYALDQAVGALRVRYSHAMEPVYATAIRDVVPADVLMQAEVVSFMIPPLSIWKSRVDQRVEVAAKETLARARNEGEAHFVAATRRLPAAAPAELTLRPKPDLARALGIAGNWDLGKPTDVGMACAELAISPALRPKISGGQ